MPQFEDVASPLCYFIYLHPYARPFDNIFIKLNERATSETVVRDTRRRRHFLTRNTAYKCVLIARGRPLSSKKEKEVEDRKNTFMTVKFILVPRKRHCTSTYGCANDAD